MASSTLLALVLSSVLAAPAGSAATASPASPPASPSATVSTPSPTSVDETPTTVTAPRLRAPRPSRWKAERLTGKKRRTARAFTGAGVGIFSVMYLGGTFVAATQLDDVREDGIIEPHERDLVRISHLMFVPVVGPLVAAPLADDRKEKLGIAGFGLLQAVGVLYLASGATMLARDQRARRWSLAAAPGPGGGSVALRGRF